MKLLTPALALLALSLSSAAQTTSDQIVVGGPGTAGCSGSDDPPTLDDGITLASGTIDCTWDPATRILDLVVTNTSPVTPGTPNPVITQIYLNMPWGAVDSVSLVDQSSATGTPSFSMDLDMDLLDGSNALKTGCFGAFGVLLSLPNGSQGGIANDAADVVGTSSWIDGPVHFQLLVDGPGLDTLSASTFCSTLSVNPPGSMQASAVLKYQGGGFAGASDKIGNAVGCAPAAWMSGEPCIGNTVTFTMSSTAGCHGCLFMSRNPGPTVFNGVSYDIGVPVTDILIAIPFPATSVISKDITIPNNTNLVGKDFHFIVADINPNTMMVELSDTFSVTICDVDP